MTKDGQRRTRRPLMVNLAWAAALVLLLAVGYVLSYAPVVRFSQRSPDGHFYPDELPFYRPVDVLIDSTPLRSPLFRWAGLWGVEEDFYYDCWKRTGINPDAPDARPPL